MGNFSIRANRGRLLFRSGSLWLIGVILGAATLPAAPLSEAEFRAATLSKIIPYVSWPRAKAPVVVGLYGRDPFGGRLHQLVRGQKTQEGRPIEVRVISRVDEIPLCHVLYVPSSKAREWAIWNRAHPQRGQMTVGEDTGFVSEMGGICSISYPSRRLEINRTNARTADLKISSRLLKIATLVDR